MAAAGAVRKRAPAVIHRQIDMNLDSDDDLFLPTPPVDGLSNLKHPSAQRRDSHNAQKKSVNAEDDADENAAVVVRKDTDDSTSGAFPGHTPYNHWGANGEGYGGPGSYGGPGVYGGSTSSIVEGLLLEIYDRWQYPQRDSLDSDTFTECSSTSEAFWRGDSVDLVGQRNVNRLNKVFLEGKGRPKFCLRRFNHIYMLQNIQ